MELMSGSTSRHIPDREATGWTISLLRASLGVSDLYARRKPPICTQYCSVVFRERERAEDKCMEDRGRFVCIYKFTSLVSVNPKSRSLRRKGGEKDITHSFSMLSKHRVHHCKAKYLDCSDRLQKLGGLLRFWSPKPLSVIETAARNCRVDMELARGISVILAEENSHLLLRRRDVNILFTAMQLGELCVSQEASNSLSTDSDSQGSTPSSSRLDHRQFPGVPSCSSVTGKSSSKESEKPKGAHGSYLIIPCALDEIWSSEEYTCVVAHGDDQKAAVTHIFSDHILECHASCMVGRKRFPEVQSTEQQIGWSPQFVAVHQSSNDGYQFMFSFCSMCNQKLKMEEDIYMFQGEAFCSSACRNHAAASRLWEEEDEEEGGEIRENHNSQVPPPESTDSDDGKLFTLGIPVIT